MNVLYANKQEFSASSWRSNQGYTKMHGQQTIKIFILCLRSQNSRQMFVNSSHNANCIAMLLLAMSHFEAALQ